MKLSAVARLVGLNFIVVANADFNGIHRMKDRIARFDEPRELSDPPELITVGKDGKPADAFPLAECQGDCNIDRDCQGPMVCYHRYQYETVPGCSGEGLYRDDYCAHRPDNYLFYVGDDMGPGALKACEGDCDADEDCAEGFACYHRTGYDPVPGCGGTGRRSSDYCYSEGSLSPSKSSTPEPTKFTLKPTNGPTAQSTNPLVSVGKNGLPKAFYPLAECQGDCDSDEHCQRPMVCYQRAQYEAVPGCLGQGVYREDYCVRLPDNYLFYVGNDLGPGALEACEGDCDADRDCAGGLTCFDRTGYDPVPGCNGAGRRSSDYCVGSSSPSKSPTPEPTKSPVRDDFRQTASPTGAPTKSPANQPTPPPTQALELVDVGNNGEPADAFPLKECQGDCDKDGDCKGELVCYHRYQKIETVPGCTGSGTGKDDYCTRRPTNYLFYIPDPAYPLELCEGDCNNDAECAGDLVCFQRSDNAPVPGCDGVGRRSADYCHYPVGYTPGPTSKPTPRPTRYPTESPVPGPTLGPTRGPTLGPTRGPTLGPTLSPTLGPTLGPTLSPTPYRAPPCTGTITAKVTITTDSWPSETGWYFTDKCDSSVDTITHTDNGGAYLTDSGETSTRTVILPCAAYDFTITDSFGDGICCKCGSGSYQLAVDDVIVASGGEFGGYQTTSGKIGSCTRADTTPSPTSSPTKSPVTPSPSKSPTGPPTTSLETVTDVPGLAQSEHYRIRVRSKNSATWLDSFAFITRSKKNNDERYYFDHLEGWTNTYTNFVMTQPVEVEISAMDGGDIGGISTAAVHPKASKLAERAEVRDGKAYVVMNGPAQIVVDINGQMDGQHTGRGYEGPPIHTVTIFANPPLSGVPELGAPGVYAVAPGQTPPTSRNRYDTLYFLPGVHDIDRAFPIWRGKTYYIPAGAIVYGTFDSTHGENYGNGDNIRIFGHGTLSGARLSHPKFDTRPLAQPTPVLMEGAHNSVLEGITIEDSAYHSVMMWAAYKPDEPTIVRWVKIFTWRANGDGINPGMNMRIEHSFLRTQDDALYARGAGMKGLVIWNDVNGVAFALWALKEQTRPLIIEDCDVVYSRKYGKLIGGRVFSMRAGGLAGIIGGGDVIFRNIRVDDPFPTYQTFFLASARDIPELGNGSKVGQGLTGVLFQNISIAAASTLGDPDVLHGHRDSPISNITFENVRIADKRIDSLAHFSGVNKYVTDIRFR